MGKIRGIFLKLNFIPITLGCYGFRKVILSKAWSKKGWTKVGVSV